MLPFLLLHIVYLYYAFFLWWTGVTIQHPHPAKAPDKGQDQDKNGREGRKNKSRVMMHLEVFGIIQDQPFLPKLSSSLCLGSWSLCFPISFGCPGSWGLTASRQRRRQGTSQLSSPMCLETGLSV